VRRLTVVECAKLQGFPDTFAHIETKSRRKIEPDEAVYLMSHGLLCQLIGDQWYTNISADGPMYKAFGNSMAVPVLAHIGRRMLRAEKLFQSDAATLSGDDW
jgi:site-specific DNA-cytosine methylase